MAKTVLKEKQNPEKATQNFFSQILTAIEGLTGNLSLLKQRIDNHENALEQIVEHMNQLKYQMDQSKFIIDFKSSGFDLNGSYSDNYKFNPKQETFVVK